jgi:hypothetical protein
MGNGGVRKDHRGGDGGEKRRRENGTASDVFDEKYGSLDSIKRGVIRQLTE